MKARLIITDDNGHTLEGEIHLRSSAGQKHDVSAKSQRQQQPKTAVKSFDFDLQERAFFKRYAGELSGPKKFVLLVAYIGKGSLGHEVALKDIEPLWNRMTTFMGGEFNRFYSNVARENDWVATSKKGVYKLRPSWLDALEP
jgi:hypothetical protein